MAELLAEHQSQIKDLVGKSLEVIEDSLISKRVFVTKDGTIVDGGEDTFARLAAVKRLIEMVQAARTEDSAPRGQTITFEMFLTLLREAEK